MWLCPFLCFCAHSHMSKRGHILTVKVNGENPFGRLLKHSRSLPPSAGEGYKLPITTRQGGGLSIVLNNLAFNLDFYFSLQD